MMTKIKGEKSTRMMIMKKFPSLSRKGTASTTTSSSRGKQQHHKSKFNNNSKTKSHLGRPSKNNQKRLFRGIALGFIIGLAVASMISMIYESDFHLRQLDMRHDMAANSMPFVHNDDRQQQQQASSCNTTTTAIPSSQRKHKRDNSFSKVFGKVTAGNKGTAVYSNTSEILVKVTKKKEQEKPTNANANTTDGRQKEDDETDHLDGLTIVDSTVTDFDPNQRVVLVTKVHGPNNLNILEQSLCLLTQAYNNRVNYDIIIFSSDPIIPKEHPQAMKIQQQIVSPANISFITDNPGLHTMVDNLSPERKDHLLERCNVTSTQQLTWYTQCIEIAGKVTLKERIAYTWQAEFRAKHLWVHPSIQKYKYMMWFDVDLFCSKVWQQDPIALMARYDVVLLFDHFPQGIAKGTEMVSRIRDSFEPYTRLYCEIMMKDGTLVAKPGNGCLHKQGKLRQVHGFFHISDLDFYRSPAVRRWHEKLIGDDIFSRQYDDQIGITVPAAVLAGNRSWDMRYHGIKLDIIHNYLFDGRHERRAGGFINWWKINGQSNFPEAYNVCTNINAAG